MICSLDGCVGPVEARGLCRRHYRQWQAGAPYPAPLARTPKGKYPICTVDGCTKPHRAKALCARHYQRQLAGATSEGSAFAPGEAHPNAKLTAESVQIIRERHAAGVSCAELARHFGVNYFTVRGVLTGRTWKTVE